MVEQEDLWDKKFVIPLFQKNHYNRSRVLIKAGNVKFVMRSGEAVLAHFSLLPSLRMSKKGASTAAGMAASVVRLLVPAGKASAQPPVGPALGSKGVKAMDFAKEFNARTGHLEVGIPTPAIITINPDRTFTFKTRTPPTSLLLKRAAGITSGSGKPGTEIAGTITMKHIYEIAKIKMQDVPNVKEEQVSADWSPRSNDVVR